MKNNKFAKISLLILSLALVLGAVFAMTASAEGDTQPVIISQNLAYEGDFALIYAVDAEGLTGSVTLNIYEENPDVNPDAKTIWSGTVDAPEYVGGNLNKTVYKFKTENGIAAKDMCKQYYAQAVANGNTANQKSEVKRYSVAEYLYERLATAPVTLEDDIVNPSDEQIALYKSVIEYGDHAQKVVGKISDAAERIKNYRYVTVKNGVLSDGFSAGVYPVGTALTPTSDMVTAWTATTYGEKSVELGEAQKNITTLNVPETEGLVHVHFEKYEAPAYNFASNDLESYSSWDELAAALVNTDKSAGLPDSVTFCTDDADRGNYLIYKTKSGSKLDFKSFDTGVTKDDATAYVASFKVKLDATNATIASNGNGAIELKLYTSTGSLYLRLSIWIYNGNESRKIGINHEGNGQSVLYDVATDEWLDIKLVQYKDDSTRVRLYVGGTPVYDLGVVTSSYGDTAFANRKNVVDNYDENLRVQIAPGSSLTNANFYFDDLFFGYTTDVKPE